MKPRIRFAHKVRSSRSSFGIACLPAFLSGSFLSSGSWVPARLTQPWRPSFPSVPVSSHQPTRIHSRIPDLTSRRGGSARSGAEVLGLEFVEEPLLAQSENGLRDRFPVEAAPG